MVALLVGGIVLVKNNVGQLGESQTPQVATDDGDAEKNGNSENEPSQTGSDADKVAEERARLEEQRRKAEEERRAREQNNAATSGNNTEKTPPATPVPTPQPATPTPTTPAAPATDRLATTGVAPSVSDSGAETDKLPHTGPIEDAAVVLTGASMLIGATIAYARSRSAL